MFHAPQLSSFSLHTHAMQSVIQRSLHHLVSRVWPGQSRHLHETTRCLLSTSKYGLNCLTILPFPSPSSKQVLLILYCAAKELFPLNQLL
jgi:hypothetical protein